MSRSAKLSNLAFSGVLAALLVVTCVPLLTLHVAKMTLDDSASGAVLVVYPPWLTEASVYRKILSANGSLIKPVAALGNAWVVYSKEPAFVKKLKSAGAWRGLSADVLNPATLLSCASILDSKPLLNTVVGSR